MSENKLQIITQLSIETSDRGLVNAHRRKTEPERGLQLGWMMCDPLYTYILKSSL